ncbi:Retrovirus-related Pol polyprotein from transposon RE2 [Vitis vinifera]|uniref:Retrovirus-related Pol polyprotein from transposon RE2 n=1 Tax=Vitis vinifera TaxID=29760 RepID=A0A438FL16_VITVI|nr:Retrovirus-related Pol polyprotein from transposon RE2 [Vitis vinifera]
MMNHHPISSLDACLSKLLREEQHVVTQVTMEHRVNVSVPVSMAYAAQMRHKSRDMRVVQCFSCKDLGHIARDFPKKFCNYCKKHGHIVSACPIWPKRKQGTAYHASTSASSSIALFAASLVVHIPTPTALANPNTLTPEMNQVSGKMTVNGPKVGQFFLLHVSPSTIIPSFPLLSFACNVVGSGNKMWHRCLGYPNADAMEHKSWQNAMQAELQALEENHTWDIVPCPPTVKPIGSKWVFSIKLRSYGSLDWYKARLVALVVATASDGVNNAFLHGDLQEEIYMKFSSGMTNYSPHDVFRCIIRYFQGSPTHGLVFPIGSSLQLVAYSDVDWAGCPDTCRSTTSWFFLRSLGFLRLLLTPLHADNTSAIQIATNPIFHERTKHIEVDCHSIRDILESWVIFLPHISSNLQVSNVFTKALTRQRHQFLVGKLLLVDLPTSI